MSTTAPPIDMTSLSATEFETRLGAIARTSLRRTGAFILLARGDGQVTIMDPAILHAVPDDAMAEALVGSWTDDEILEYLAFRERMRDHGGG